MPGTVLAPRDREPGAFGAAAAPPLAALPADLHGALREAVAADVAPPPAAGADGFRTLTGHRFPDPDDPVAGRFGFRGGVFPSAERVATGELDPSAKPAQRCLDRDAA